MKNIKLVGMVFVILVIVSLGITPVQANPNSEIEPQNDPYGAAISEFHAWMGWQTPLQIRPDQPYWHAYGEIDASCPGMNLTINISEWADGYGWINSPDAKRVDFHGREALDWRYTEESNLPTIAKRVDRLIWMGDDNKMGIEIEKSFLVQEKKNCMEDARYDLYHYADEFYCILVKHGAIQDKGAFCGGGNPPPSEVPVAGSTALAGRVTDGYGNPIPLAPVFLYIGDQSLETRTDSGGNYQFADLPVNQPNFNVIENAVMAQVCLSYYDPSYNPVPGTPYPYFSVRYAEESSSVVCAYTQPFFLPEMPGTHRMDIDLGSPASLQQDALAQIHPDLPAHLADIANNYFHTTQAIALAHLLGQPLDLPVDIVPFMKDTSMEACWKGRISSGNQPWNSCLGIQTEYNFLAYNEGNSTYNAWNRPANREWHEFGHHFQADSFGNLMPVHSIQTNHAGYYVNPSSTDAWNEGFAEFYSLMVKREVVRNPIFTVYPYGYGSVIDLELNYLAWDSEEDAVAGLLLDLVDNGADYQGASNQDGLRTNPHADDDLLSVPLKDLWKIIVTGKSNSPDSSLGYLSDVEDLYRTLVENGIGQDDLNANGYSDLDEVFIAHGFHADVNGNKQYDAGETIGHSDHPQHSVQDSAGNVTTYNAMSPRENKSDLAGGYLVFHVVDPQGRTVPVEHFTVDVKFDAPYQSYNYSYDVPANLTGSERFYLVMPPSSYASTATITPGGDDISSSTSTFIKGSDYWNRIPNPNDLPLGEFTFTVQPATESILPSSLSLVAVSGVLGACCLGVSFLILIGGVVMKKKKISVLGLVLIVGLVGIIVIAGVFYFGSQLNQPASTDQALDDTDPSQGEPAAQPEHESVPASLPLSPGGPWLLLSTENGLWAINEDGSGLTRITTERIIAPSDLSTGLSPENPYFAFITATDPVALRGLALNMLSLPDGKVKTITALTSPVTEPAANADVCDPNLEAARSVTIGNSIAWSPDGSKMAFPATLSSQTADVYVYSIFDGSIARVSDEPGQAYDLHWNRLPGSETIVYFSASCFGTGAGFNMEGAWMTRSSMVRAEQVYQPNSETWGEVFISWVFGKESYFVASVSGCPYRDLRMVEPNTGEITPIFEGCFEDFAVGPTNSLAVLTSSDFSDQPGLYLFSEPNIPGIPPVYIPEANGREVRHIPPEIFISVTGQDNPGIRSLDWDGQPGWYQGRGDFPVVSRDGSAWVWNEGGVFYLKSKDMSAPVILLQGDALHPFWYETISPSGEIHQRLLFFDGQGNLYMISSPEFVPTLLASNLAPVSTPMEMYLTGE
ncbi:MAG: hypothetical protein C4583_04015 [Anaerolineaceae bacterium]|nr:MAG: hypothetical protein C4583_04015 [Anaerolineaceae bacterium]